MRKTTSAKKSIAFRISLANLAWAVKQASAEDRKLSAFIDLLITRAREKK